MPGRGLACCACVQVQVLDLWTQMQKQSDWQTQLFDDGLHFTPEGQAFVWSQLQPLMEKAFPWLRREICLWKGVCACVFLKACAFYFHI